jgi:hypothetical protein
MPKFVRKPVEVEAFQMTKGRRWDNSEWPQWLHEAWQMDPGVSGSLYPVIDLQTGEASDNLLIGFEDEFPMLVAMGDWIVKDENDNLLALRPSEFEEQYESTQFQLWAGEDFYADLPEDRYVDGDSIEIDWVAVQEWKDGPFKGLYVGRCRVRPSKGHEWEIFDLKRFGE